MPLPEPEGRQKEVLYLPTQGYIVVLGTAGSGKTTLAILRAAYLAGESFTERDKRVLLVTFSRTLVNYMSSLAPQFLKVDVRNYHRFARGYLSSRRNRQICVANKDVRTSLIRLALNEAKRIGGTHSIYERPIEMLSTEFEWIAKSGIRTSKEYFEAERVGRAGTRVEREDRDVLYDVYERYLKLRSARGYDCDWDDMALEVLDEFARDTSPRMYQHIVIDEGQDFSPTMLRSLAAAVPSDGSLMFFGDVAQQIYGTRISWRSAGLPHPKIWRFEENYRNSKQIARLALAISKMPYFQGDADLVEPREPRADGPLPTLVLCKNKDREFSLVLEQAMRIGRTQSVAILMRNRDKEGEYIRKLGAAGISVRRLHRETQIWSSSPGVFIGTYFSAKGLEFDTVLLPNCSADILPDASRIVALGNEDDAMAEEGQLLYVAVTRARTGLILAYSGEITLLLPADDSLYQRVKADE